MLSENLDNVAPVYLYKELDVVSSTHIDVVKVDPEAEKIAPLSFNYYAYTLKDF